MARRKVTGDELSARAKENGYQWGAHRDKDSLRDQNKHVDKVKKDQNAALDRYILYGGLGQSTWPLGLQPLPSQFVECLEGESETSIVYLGCPFINLSILQKK
jgi:hypothetical protein